MIECSAEVIVAADATKVGRSAFARITDAKKTSVLVTSSEASPDEIAALRDLGIRVIGA
jgi:DeoR/GlpR family transcriptional regulator of sugar metabolism